jgi:hypothetical protein
MKNTRYIVLILSLIICLMTVTVSCGLGAKPLETEADFTGFITDIDLGIYKDIAGRISVESHADKIVTKYIITIKKDAGIFRQDGENLRKAAFADLAAKQSVKIWLTGPVLESWPIQATAQQIVFTE